MTSQFQTMYFQNTSRIILPAPAPSLSDEDKIVSAKLTAGIYANFASAGYQLAPQDIEKLKMASPEDLVQFHDIYMNAINEQLGADLDKARIFYPGFPQQVIDSEGIERYFDQILHYLSGGELTPALRDNKYAHDMAVSLKSIKTRPLISETVQQAAAYVQNTYKSVRPWSEGQYLLIREALNCPEFPTPTEALYSHENRALYAYLRYQQNTNIRSRRIAEICPQPTDILRFAAILSQPEHSEYAALAKAAHLDIDKHTHVKDRFNLHNTSTRNLILYSLNEAISKTHSTEEALLDMWKKTNLIHWKALFTDIHAANKKVQTKAPYTYQVANCVFGGIAPQRIATEIEKSINEKNVEKLVQLLSKKPGEFVRRFDKLLRLAEEFGRTDLVCQALVEASVKAGIATLLGLMSIVEARQTDEFDRSVKFVKNGKTVVKRLPINKNRRALQPQTYQMFKNACRQVLAPENLQARFSGKPELGKIYISPETDHYQLPLNTREASLGMASYGAGTEIQLDQNQPVKRFFVAWTNTESRVVDIDLSARVIIEDPETKTEREELISWNGQWCDSGARWNSQHQNNTLAVFSGDIVDGGDPNGPGAIEFIDVNMDVAKQNHVKSIIVEAHSYNSIPFDRIPHICMGFLDREYGQEQPHFHIATVNNKIKLNTAAIGEIMAKIDVDSERLLWLDMPTDGNIASQSRNVTDAIIKYVEEHKTLSIHDLAMCNAVANEGVANNIEDAKTVIMTRDEYEQFIAERPDVDMSNKNIVFPSDISSITGLLLANGTPAQMLTREKVLQEPTKHKKHRSQDDFMH